MQRQLAVLIGLIALTSAGGCGDGNAPSAKSASRPAVPVQPKDSEQPGDHVVEVERAAEASSPPAAEASKEATAAPETKAAERRESEADAVERIAILAPGGPLVVDVWLTIDGRSHADVFTARLREVIEAGDVDADGRSTWKELAGNDKFLEAQRATNPNNADGRTKAWTERFDLNRDKRIQPAEAAAWLGRDAGRSLAALSMRSRRSYHALPSLGSRVWQLVDADGNGRLEASEISTATEKFFLLDANDDRTITPPELARLRDQLSAANPQMADAPREESRHAAVKLEGPGDVDQLDYLLVDLYAPRQELGPGSFPALARLFRELDTSSDDRLESQELAGLLTIDPHLELAVAFEKPSATDGRGEARLEIREHGPEISVVAQTSTDRIVFALGGTRITVSAHDLAVPESDEQVGERSEIRAMIHDESDALFEELDRNADGRLGEREITTCAERMLARDGNEDGMLTNEELPSAMVVAFLRGEQPAEKSFYSPDVVVAGRQDAKAPPWFAPADFNGDGDVSRREFLGSIKQFSQLDADDDGYIAVEEAEAFRVD